MNRYDRYVFPAGLGASLGAIVLALSATLCAPTATAQPGCNASSLSAALGTVASQTGAWLDAHPAANEVITGVGASGDREAVRVYFLNNQAEWAELQGIAAPLRSLRAQCGGDGATKAAQIGDLYSAMAS